MEIDETDSQRREILSLEKNGNHYVFAYAPGRERDILKHLTDLAEDPNSGIDLVDATILSSQVVQRIK